MAFRFNSSACGLCTKISMSLLRLCCVTEDLRYVLMHLSAEKDLSPVAVVTGKVR